MVSELHALEQRIDAIAHEIMIVMTPERVPHIHPDIPALYRQTDDSLEWALTDLETAAIASGAPREMVDAIINYPGTRRGEVQIQLRRDSASFVYLDDFQSAHDKNPLPVMDAAVFAIFG
jgi:hypothetical protein